MFAGFYDSYAFIKDTTQHIVTAVSSKNMMATAIPTQPARSKIECAKTCAKMSDCLASRFFPSNASCYLMDTL